jgi:hypothetical protein
MPIEWEGRPAIVRPAGLPDADPDGPYRLAKYRQMWQLIEAKKTTRFWWSISDTLNWSCPRLQKAVKAMREAKYRRGVRKELTILCTVKEGVVFRWNEVKPAKDRLEVVRGR